MVPIDPTTPIPVTLSAQDWNQVLTILGRVPYSRVAQLIARIAEQAQSAAAGHAPHVQPPLMNGAAAHVPD